MASKGLAQPLIRYITKKSYGTAVTPAIKEARIQCTVLPSCTFVAALDNGSPVTRITIAFKAGSRYEPLTEPGISHLVRASAGLTTAHSSNFLTARKLAQIGANVTASGDREFMYYTLETTNDHLGQALDYLNNMISGQEFRPWELSEIEPKLRYDITSLAPQVRAVDLLHKAAFRRGLGNSLYCSPKRIGSFSSESLQHYASSALTPNRCAVTIVGDSQDKAVLLSQALRLPTCGAEACSEKTQYYGGEHRKETAGEVTHIAIALPGAASGTPQSLAYAIAAKALGSGPVCKWGVDQSPLAKAIGNIGPFAVAGFNASYSDAGLFGFVLSVPKDEAGVAVKAAVNVLKGAKLNAKDIKAGRAALRNHILTEFENGTASAESLAAQGLYTGVAKSSIDLANDVNAISDNDVLSAINSAASSKLSMAAVGNLAFVPFVDEL